MKKLIFEVSGINDPAAGVVTYGDTITVTVESGDPGGEKGEFEAEITGFLADWYDAVVVQHAVKS